jgi:hypothetical protein
MTKGTRRIYYQFSTSRGVGSWFIRWFTWSEFSHVDLVEPDGWLLGARLFANHAPSGKGGVQRRPPEYVKFTKTLRVCIEVTQTQYETFWAEAHRQIGKKYDWLAVFGFLFKKDWQNQDRWFCSEFGLWVAVQAGVRMLNLSRIDRCSPELLLCSPEFHREDEDEYYKYYSEWTIGKRDWPRSPMPASRTFVK